MAVEVYFDGEYRGLYEWGVYISTPYKGDPSTVYWTHEVYGWQGVNNYVKYSSTSSSKTSGWWWSWGPGTDVHAGDNIKLPETDGRVDINSYWGTYSENSHSVELPKFADSSDSRWWPPDGWYQYLWPKIGQSGYYNNLPQWISTTGGSGGAVYQAWAEYRRTIWTLTLDQSIGSGGTDKIYYWNGKWYSDSNCTIEISKITVPSRDDATFIGYGSIIDSEGNISGSISSNQTITATWEELVSFNLDGNINPSDYPNSHISPSSISPISFIYNDKYSDLPNKPSREGFDCLGWYTERTGGELITNTSTVTIPGAHTLYARWQIKQYTVTARNSEGITEVKVGDNPSGITSTGTYNYWDQVIISAEVDEETEPSPGTQYLFSEWLDLNNLSPSGAPQSVSDQNPYTFRVIEDTDYEATTYSGARTYTVTLTSNNFIVKYGYYDGEERVSEHTITGLLYGDIIKLWAIPRNDYLGYCEFDGWFNGNLKVIPVNKFADESDYQVEVKGNMTITAKASLIVPRFEIKLKNNGYNHTNQNGGVVSINYVDGYGYGSANKLVNPGETKSVYVLRELANNSSLTLKVESTEYGYQFNDWEKGSWSSTDPEWQARTITQEGTYEANFDLWNKDGATWKSYYIFVKTADPDLPWKIVKEIDVRVKENNEEKWKESSKAPSQP